MSAAPTLLKLIPFTLEVLKGPNQGEKFAFEKSRVTVGRGPENDIILGQDVKVSRLHLELVVTPHEIKVRNLSQKNPITVDGQLTNEKALYPGATVFLGDSELKINFEKALDLLKPILAPVPATVEHPPFQNQTVSTALAPISEAFPPVPAQVAMPPSTHLAPKPKPGGAGGGYKPPAYQPAKSGSGAFYGILIVVILGAAYLFTDNQIKKRAEIRLRDTATTEVNINKSQSEYDKTMKEIEKKGLDTIQYRMAQEQYLRGFRDYRQGQYLRGMEGFQAALSFYPQHELARKYYTLSKRKFDEQIQFNMIQGKRYYGISNYRLCMGFYANVIKMKKDEKDPIRREAVQYYNECELKMRGKY